MYNFRPSMITKYGLTMVTGNTPLLESKGHREDFESEKIYQYHQGKDDFGCKENQTIWFIFKDAAINWQTTCWWTVPSEFKTTTPQGIADWILEPSEKICQEQRNEVAQLHGGNYKITEYRRWEINNWSMKHIWRKIKIKFNRQSSS